MALEEKLRRENLAEEQRILYVAMTRPKEKLILVDSMYFAPGRVQKLAAMASCPVLPETVAAGRTFGDWILLPLLCRPEAAALRAFADADVQQLYTGDTRHWQVFIHDSEEYRQRPTYRKERQREEGQETAFDPKLLDFVYPYQRETLLPAKVTATQLKGRRVDEEIAENAAHTPYIRPLSQPKFRQMHHGLTPAEQGTATHLVLQYLDFADHDLEGQIERLCKNHMLTEQQARAVDREALEKFLDSTLAEEIRRGKNVLREYRFTLLMEARQYDPEASEEDRILLQGVVDCCYEIPEGLVVVDFKTDHVRTEKDIAQRAERYRRQLEAYSLALEQVLERPVVRRLLCFLYSGKIVEI